MEDGVGRMEMMCREIVGCVDILRRLFLPTVNIYGGVPGWCVYGT